MGLKCDHEKREAIAVCHHCGAPLCDLSIDISGLSNRKLDEMVRTHPRDSLCGFIIEDRWFFEEIGRPKTKAFHCEACLEQFHPEERPKLEKLKNSLHYYIDSL